MRLCFILLHRHLISISKEAKVEEGVHNVSYMKDMDFEIHLSRLE